MNHSNLEQVFDNKKTEIQSACEAAKQIFVAYSGGVDSHVLLHLSAASSLKDKITAVYVNHGLQEQANSWAAHCAQIASLLGIGFRELSVDARQKRRESPEETARNERYQALQSLLAENDVLLLAQHREDQMETVLLQLFRGAGLAGLSGMPEKMDFGKGILLRPFIDVSKQQIKDYAAQHKLHWIEDPTNVLNDFDRNYLRNEIVPLIKKRWPSVDKTISRSARHCAGAEQLLGELTEQRYSAIINENANILLIQELVKLEKNEQPFAIRKWLYQITKKMPSEQFIKQVFDEVINARDDRCPELRFQNLSVRRFQDKIYALPKQPGIDTTKKLGWSKNQAELNLQNNGVLRIVSSGSGIEARYWRQAKIIEVGYRQGGEKLNLPGRKGRHKLKNLFQEAGVPPWERARIPFLYFDGRLVAVGENWVAAEFYGEQGDCCKLAWLR